jgi:hypothetical protein
LKAKQASQEITSLEQKGFPELANIPEEAISAIDQSNEVLPQEKIVPIVKPNSSGGKWPSQTALHHLKWLWKKLERRPLGLCCIR